MKVISAKTKKNREKIENRFIYIMLFKLNDCRIRRMFENKKNKKKEKKIEKKKKRN